MSAITEPKIAGIFHPRRLGHANLWVDDLKRSEIFYNSVCGLSVEFWETDLVATFLGTGTTPHDLGMIETTGGTARYGLDGLLQIPEGVGTTKGLGHLAWELTNEVDLVDGYRQLADLGIEADMTVDHQIAHSVYIRDPDGLQIEFYCDTVKEWNAVLHGELKLVTSPWTPGAEEPFSESRVADDPQRHVVEDAPVHPQRLTHAVLTTSNLEGLVDFYQRIAGLSLVAWDHEHGVAWLGGSEPSYRYNLVLASATDGDPGYHHVAFDLGDEQALDEALAKLERAGVLPERTFDGPTKRSFFLVDPDGLRAEFYALRGGAMPDLSGVAAADRVFAV
jgi:catechol 2,3-dioxygenase